MSVVAVGSAVLAVLLLVRPPARLTVGSPPAARGLVAPLVLAGGLAVAVAAPALGALVLVAAGAATASGGLWRRRRRRRRAEQTSADVLETCELLAGELAAGRPPGEALDRAATAWAPLAPVAAAFHVGADVPAALRAIAADREGAGDLRVVAAAWQVAHRTGSGLSAAVDRVAESLRAASATRRLVAGELASARATARLVAALPVLALAMGSGAGGDPWGFLLGHPAGIACLAGGLGFGLAGLWWIEAIAGAAEEAR
jgi:tight adherence protein B